MRDLGDKRSTTWSRDLQAAAAGPGSGKQTLTEMLSPASSPVQRKTASSPAMPSGPRPTLHELFGGVQRTAAGSNRAPIQQRASGDAADHDPAAVHEAAQQGIATAASPLPHFETIQRLFGHHDISGIQSHTGAAAAASAHAMGAQAYATGTHVVLGGRTDLHTVAHEAAHVVQQRAGDAPASGIGQAGDRHERHADAVADLVVQGRSAEALLADRVGPPGAKPPGPAPSTQRSPIQRQIVIHPRQFFAGIGVPEGEVPTVQELRAYLDLAVRADAARAIQLVPAHKAEIEERLAQLEGATRVDRALLLSLRGLVDGVNRLLLAEEVRLRHGKPDHTSGGTQTMNGHTRYATNPKPATKYTHPSEAKTWGEDRDAHDALVGQIGDQVMDGRVATTPPREREGEPLVQLDWHGAMALFPAPLINLIFDLRYQIEPAPAGWQRRVIDERTKKEQDDHNTTPTQPGSLRSWHEDSKGLLPDNGFVDSSDSPKKGGTAWNDRRKSKKPAKGRRKGKEIETGKEKEATVTEDPALQGEKELDPQRDQIREPSRLLHDHYKKTSGTGEGASIKGVKGPRGFAEYTGAGSNNAHNIKIVLDYMTKRVYLSMTHYQYWATYRDEAECKFFDCRTQTKVQAQGEIKAAQEGTGNWIDNPILKGKKFTLMSPWLEVIMPSRDTSAGPTQDTEPQDEQNG